MMILFPSHLSLTSSMKSQYPAILTPCTESFQILQGAHQKASLFKVFLTTTINQMTRNIRRSPLFVFFGCPYPWLLQYLKCTISLCVSPLTSAENSLKSLVILWLLPLIQDYMSTSEGFHLKCSVQDYLQSNVKPWRFLIKRISLKGSLISPKYHSIHHLLPHYMVWPLSRPQRV